MAKVVQFQIKIEGSAEVKNVTVDAKQLAEAFSEVKSEVKDLDTKLVTFSSRVKLLESVSDAVNQLNGMMSSLANAYSQQETAEAKLAQAMRNTMGATDEEIQSIKDLTSAQQKLGVVGDEVQLAASQELATYLEYSSSLKAIIPVMNDMIAQQLGLGASAESATQIATMLGKVMNGQTEALSRYGYKFNEAQKEILQFGTESERAAVLAQVVSESVGGMNEALAKTNSGKQQQMANRLGDVAEACGRVISSVMPVISAFAAFSSSVFNVVQIAQAISAISVASLKAKISSLAAAAAHKSQALAAKILGISEIQAATATGALRTQIMLLQTAMTFGLAVVIQTVINLIVSLTQKSKEASGAIDAIDEASEAFQRTASEMRAELAMETVALQDLIKGKKDTTEAVNNLNAKYGEAFGCHKTAAEWYDVLVAKSSTYCQQLGYEAQAKVLASQKAAKELELEELRRRKNEIKAGASKGGFFLARNDEGKLTGWGIGQHYTKEYADLLRKERELSQETENLGAKFGDCMRMAADAAREMGGTLQTTGAAGVQQVNAGVNNIADDIAAYRQSVERAIQVNRALGSSKSDEVVQLESMRSGLTSLISKYGSESEAVRQLINEYYNLRKAKAAAVGMTGALETPGISGLPNGVAVPDTGQLLHQDAANTINLDVNGTDKVAAATQSLSALGETMNSLSNIVGEGAAKWLSWGANVISAIAQAIPSIVALTNAKRNEATANAASMATGAGSAVSSIPYVGPVLAIAAIASVLAAVASLPKFATGGIAYGPTLGLFGEYAGAANNPEVVAPLDRLRSLIGIDASGVGSVQFRIRGRDLVGILQKEDRISNRVG